jgi:DNA mismatch repair protein MutL
MSSSPVIQLLPDQIINKIAAGEVVDRPASVVKELVENAIDAGTKHIHVSIVDGGLKLISVADDGHGMDRDNALLSIERHATSKIRHVDDIERVATLGFRGEALAAIASVSRFTLATRRAGDISGTEIRINGGRMEEVTETGCPPGTRIDVRQIFFNVPARRKFLKAPATELNHIRQVFMLYAMGRPDVGLRLSVDDRELYRLDGDSQLEDRIRQLYGPEILRDLVPVEWTNGGWSIRGLVSKPVLHRSDKSEQYIFVNGRPASAPILGYAVGESYQEHLPRGRHPLIFLFIDLPPDEVDVNVHPTKKEVRFRHAAPLRDAMMTAIRHALHPPKNNQPAAGMSLEVPTVKPDIKIGEFLKVPDLPVLPAFDYPRKKEASVSVFKSDGRPVVSAGAPEPASASFRAPWHWCRILGQIAEYFVVLETDEGMIIMDPQAAHERVLFDRLMQEIRRQKISTQGLLVPETVTLSPVKAGIIRRQLKVLKEIGVGVSEFGGDTFIVESMPAKLGPVGGGTLLNDIAEKIELLGKSNLNSTLMREQMVQTAAQLAVRTTTQLSREELEVLISDLAMTELPYTSPRGRPTLIFTSVQELKKKFGRS